MIFLCTETVCLSKGWFHSVKNIPYNHNQLTPQGVHEDDNRKLSLAFIVRSFTIRLFRCLMYAFGRRCSAAAMNLLMGRS